MSDTPEIRGLKNIFESSLDAMVERAEMRGLAAIVNDAGTLHGIAEPPDPADFADQASYVQAYDQWWTDTNCWKVTRTEP